MRRTITGVVGLASLLGLLAAANVRHEPSQVRVDWQLARVPAPKVLLERPARLPIARSIAARGFVEPIAEAKVRPSIPGRVSAVLVEDGAKVAKGDLLIRLDDAEMRTRIDTSKARVDTAKATLVKAEAAVPEAERLVREHDSHVAHNYQVPPQLAGATARLAAAKGQVEARRGEVTAAEAAVKALTRELAKFEVHAPQAGVVEELAAAVGDEVSPSPSGLVAGPPLLILIDPTRLRLRVLIDEADIPLVHDGQSARVFLAPDPRTAMTGTVERVATRGQLVGQVVGFAALVLVDDPKSLLRAGMRANVEVEVARATSPLGVPAQAVLRRQPDELPPGLLRSATTGDRSPRVVFVAEGGLARVRLVEPGLSDERRVEIVRGLGDSDLVVIGPFRALDGLKDGDRITADGASAQ